MLDFRLKSFLTVCQTMHITKAALKLHITQPAVSHHIHSLEEDYGTKLFLQKGKKLELTEAGKLLRDGALTMRHDADILKEQIQGLARGEKPLIFGATLTVGEFAMPQVLKRYLKRYPSAQIVMQVADTRRLLEDLDGGNIDFAVVEGYFPRKDYDSLLFSRQRFIPVCAKGYDFQKPVKEVEDLLEERLLVRESGSGSRHILQTYLETRNLSIEDFPHRVEIGSIGAMKALACSGLGITFLYEIAVKKELEDEALKEIALKDFQIYHDFSFIWRKNSLFSQRYRDIFQDFAALEKEEEIT